MTRPFDREPAPDPGLQHRRNLRFAALLLFFCVLIRSVLLGSVWGDLRHGSAVFYGSTAIGLATGSGLTFRVDEVQALSRLPDNRTGDYRTLRTRGAREPLTEFLPGPAVLLAGLWSVLPAGARNFAPLLVLQILLESLAIAALFLALSLRVDRFLAVSTAIFAAVNPAAIRRTLMVGYDAWPQIAVMLLFAGALVIHRGRTRPILPLALGAVCGALLWFREIILFLPFFVAAYLAVRGRTSHGWTLRRCGTMVLLLLGPVVLSIALLSLHRLELTGSPRPTRSTFWHTFFAGVGQFPNPYGLENDDQSVWAFGQRIAPGLAGHSLAEMYQLPESPYEQALRAEAKRFMTRRPDLFLRNVVLRWGVMSSPLLYTGGDFLPRRGTGWFLALGWLMLPVWILGLFTLRRANPEMFGLTATFYAYFFLVFGWYYVNGRVMLPYVFLTFLVCMAGARALSLRFLPARWRTRWGHGTQP
jgi:hypothetical protein